MSCITCPITADLVSRLLAEPAQRLGRHKGFDEILEHDYFNTPSFLEIKDLYDGVG